MTKSSQQPRSIKKLKKATAAKRHFKWSERYAVWLHWGPRCYWCAKPLDIRIAENDHFMPEYLASDQEAFAQVRKDYELPDEFSINDYCNWLPCHPWCNRSKSKTLPPRTFQTAETLRRLARDSRKVRLKEEKVRKDVDTSKLIGQLAVWLENKVLKPEEVDAVVGEFRAAKAEELSLPQSIIRKQIEQQYFDLYFRTPDPDGLAFWSQMIRELRHPAEDTDDDIRLKIGLKFFLSDEFVDTGYLIERIYKTAFGDMSGISTVGGVHQLPVPIVRFTDFLPDTQKLVHGVISGQTGWKDVLEQNKFAFVSEFVSRSRFMISYPASLTPAMFVDQLNINAGSVLSASQRNALVSAAAAGAKTRAQLLLSVAETPALKDREFKQAFVLILYFTYLRRNPNDAPNNDFSEYESWLTKLNQSKDDANYGRIVKAFLSSDEYRRRFEPSSQH